MVDEGNRIYKVQQESNKETLQALEQLQRELREIEQILAGRLLNIDGQLSTLISEYEWRVKGKV